VTQQNIERLANGYVAFAAGDVESALALVHPDIEVDVHTGPPDMGRTTYQGHEGFLANIAEMTDVFDDFKLDPESFDDRGDRIMAVVRVSGRGKMSGAGIDVRLFHVWTLVDEMATRLEVYRAREHALAALQTVP